MGERCEDAISSNINEFVRMCVCGCGGGGVCVVRVGWGSVWRRCRCNLF